MDEFNREAEHHRFMMAIRDTANFFKVPLTAQKISSFVGREVNGLTELTWRELEVVHTRIKTIGPGYPRIIRDLARSRFMREQAENTGIFTP